MAARNGNCNLKKLQLFIEIPFIWFNNLNSVESRKYFFFLHLNIHLAAYWTAPPAAAAPLPPSYAPGLGCRTMLQEYIINPLKATKT
jgi:hypothetical protein